MKKRETPKSIERQVDNCKCDSQPLPEAKPYDYANQPDDLPSVEYWYKVRDAYLFQQERLSQPG